MLPPEGTGMRREVVYRGLDAAPRIAEALDRAAKRIEKQAVRFDHGSAFMRVVLAAHPTRSRFTTSVRLTLRGAVLHAREERTDPVVSIRDAFADVKQQLQRHASQSRREHLRERVPHPAAVLAEEIAERAGREIEVLEPLNTSQLEQLQRFVRREVFYRRLDGRLPFGISPDAVVDETVVLALEEADERPNWLSYDAWLLRLARRALDGRSAVAPTAGNGADATHLEYEAYETGLLDPPSDDDWLTYFQPDENPSVGDVTVDRNVFSPEDHLARRELQSHVHRILGQLPQAWRHAFTLCTIEGFEFSAAASSLDSDSDEIRRQVALATEFLREKLRETGYVSPEAKTA